VTVAPSIEAAKKHALRRSDSCTARSYDVWQAGVARKAGKEEDASGGGKERGTEERHAESNTERTRTRTNTIPYGTEASAAG